MLLTSAAPQSSPVTNEGEHGADGVAAGFRAAGVVHFAQRVAQAAQGVGGQGAAGSAGGFGDSPAVFGGQRAEAVASLPFGGQFAQGPAEALAGEFGAAAGLDDHEAPQLHDELEAVGAGHGVPADPFVAVLEAFGRPGPAKHGDEPLGAAFRIALPGALPEDAPGGPACLEVVLRVQHGAQLADFERFGGSADERRGHRFGRRTG
jgi:hypothetical protein